LRLRFAVGGALAALAGLAVGPLPALGTNQTVTAMAFNRFVPQTVTISPGESVTWQNSGGGDHNVDFDDGSYRNGDPSTANWTATRTFTTPGTFSYHCDVHVGEGMVGAVVVQGAHAGPF